MGRTLPSITQAFLQEQESLARFRRALRLEDQRALDDLLAASRHHLAAAAYASHMLPFEAMLLAMLVEEHKQVLHLRHLLETLHPDLTEARNLGPRSQVGAACTALLPPSPPHTRHRAALRGDSAPSADPTVGVDNASSLPEEGGRDE